MYVFCSFKYKPFITHNVPFCSFVLNETWLFRIYFIISLLLLPLAFLCKQMYLIAMKSKILTKKSFMNCRESFDLFWNLDLLWKIWLLGKTQKGLVEKIPSNKIHRSFTRNNFYDLNQISHWYLNFLMRKIKTESPSLNYFPGKTIYHIIELIQTKCGNTIPM